MLWQQAKNKFVPCAEQCRFGRQVYMGGACLWGHCSTPKTPTLFITGYCLPARMAPVVEVIADVPDAQELLPVFVQPQ